jgi:ATP-binding cassette, subfamily B, bacterial
MAGAQIAFDLRNRLYDHIQRLSFSFHDHAQSGQLISRCIEDVRSLQNFTGSGIVELSRVVMLMVRHHHHPVHYPSLLALISLIPLVPLTLMTTSFGKRVGRNVPRRGYALGELSSRLQENVTGVQVVRAFAREKHEIGRFENANQRCIQTPGARGQRNGARHAHLEPADRPEHPADPMVWRQYGAERQLTMGELVAFNSYVLMLAGPAQQIAGW